MPSTKSALRQATEAFECDEDVMVVDLVDSSDSSDVSLQASAPTSFTFSPHRCQFNIDRADKDCFTPTRNPSMKKLLKHTMDLVHYCTDVTHQLVSACNRMNEPAMQTIQYGELIRANVKEIFVPVAATFVFNAVDEESSSGSGGSGDGSGGETKQNSSGISLSPKDIDQAVSKHCKGTEV